MSIGIEDISIKGMKKADFRQLEAYIEHIEEEGIYWGNKEHFYKRHERIKNLISEVCEKLYDGDYKIT